VRNAILHLPTPQRLIMSRWFNTIGPCHSDRHYTLAPTRRLPNLQRLIDQQSYFVLHAPRQIGKTTAMLAFAQELTNAGRYAAVVVSAQVGAPFNDDPGAAELAILSSWQRDAKFHLPQELQPPPWPEAPPGQRIQWALDAWSRSIPRPLVLFIDEIDALQDQALLSILRQLRDGFPTRPTIFPQALALIGLRDIRDYKVRAHRSGGEGPDRLNTASPFNIKAESFTLRNFHAEEVAELYQQHTDETGQVFTPEAVQRAFEVTDGQPWLVNALARQMVEVLAPDPATVVTVDLVEAAKQLLIDRRDTHLDSLAERLSEQRVQRVLEPMLAGLELPVTPNDDRQYLVDIGLLKRDPAGGLVIANPIYREILPRTLSSGPQDSLPVIAPTWLTASGDLNLEVLRQSFMAFWLQHGEALMGSAPYHEIAPHLVLMAFLDRVANGGGSVDREYAIGRDRMDLCLRYRQQVLGIEVKVWRDRKSDPLPQGLVQLESYLARLGQDVGWLVIFDRRSNHRSDRRSQEAELEERLTDGERLTSCELTTEQGRQITVIRA
jgi:hypothetical protein